MLYANYGLRANQAPIAASLLPNTLTHTDRVKHIALDTIAQDLEGDAVYWRILSASHGTAKLSSDGATILFTPAPGYTGMATVTVQADDGFASSAPIALSVNVGGAKLLALRLAPLTLLRAGEMAVLHATADFADETAVPITDPGYLTVTHVNLGAITGTGPRHSTSKAPRAPRTWR